MIAAVRAASSARPVGFLRCVDRCWPRTRQARRSETPSSSTTRSTHWRRREGLRSFPVQPHAGSWRQASGRRPPCEGARSPSQDPSAASLDRPSARHTRDASGNRFAPRSRRADRMSGRLATPHAHLNLAKFSNNFLWLRMSPAHFSAPLSGAGLHSNVGPLSGGHSTHGDRTRMFPAGAAHRAADGRRPGPRNRPHASVAERHRREARRPEIPQPHARSWRSPTLASPNNQVSD